MTKHLSDKWRVICDLCHREVMLASTDGSLIEAKRAQLIHMLDHGEMSQRMFAIIRREQIVEELDA